MIRTALTAAALTALLAAGAQAQQTAPEPATPPAMAPADAAPPMGAAHEAETGAWAVPDFAAISTDKLKGVDLVNFQGEKIAAIDDVLIANDGKVEGVVVTFGGVLGFGGQKVLLQPEEIEVMQDADHNLQARTSLTPEAIEARPAYEES